MLNGISKEAVTLSKESVEIKCRSFTEDGEEYSGKWQKETFKKALSKSKSRILVGSPDIISSEVLFVKCFNILDEKHYNCKLITEQYLRNCKYYELLNLINDYDYLFLSGLGNDQLTLTPVRRLLQDYDLGLIISYRTFYVDFFKNRILSEHNPVLFDKEYLCFGNFDSYIYQNKLSSPKELQKLK